MQIKRKQEKKVKVETKGKHKIKKKLCALYLYGIGETKILSIVTSILNGIKLKRRKE